VPWHVRAKLPDGRIVCADFRDPAAKLIRRLHRDTPSSSDIADATTWLDNHADESEACAAGTCQHD
jgi:hypothetical protein